MSIENHILLSLLNTYYLLVYHATRLLPHEKEDVLTNGLQILTESLVLRKLQEAVRYEYLTKSMGEELQRESASWDNSGGKRVSQVCLVFGKEPFGQKNSGLSHFFDQWGGEFISSTDAGEKYRSRLMQLGEPAIVKALLPISTRSSIDIYPELTVSFIRALRGEDSSSILHLENESIPSKYILDILRPEDMANRK